MAFLSYALLTSLFLTLLGTGAVYSFDPVGSYEREACRAAGAAQSLVQPFLDNQVSTNFFLGQISRGSVPVPTPIFHRLRPNKFIPLLLPCFALHDR